MFRKFTPLIPSYLNMITSKNVEYNLEYLAAAGFIRQCEPDAI